MTGAFGGLDQALVSFHVIYVLKYHEVFRVKLSCFHTIPSPFSPHPQGYIISHQLRTTFCLIVFHPPYNTYNRYHRKGHSMATAQSSVIRIMKEFASNTGLSPATLSPRRYLWTDAFAVCNFLGLHRQTGDGAYEALAVQLMEQVHNTLGRHRSDDAHKGWISGLGEEEGKLHPTAGGLRIGKKNQERALGDTYDDNLEWDRDGQYFHYVTKWMHALNRMSSALGDTKYNVWAAELAKTAHQKFTYKSGSRQKRMYWKMSIDLSRPQVLSMGHHDPLDGYVTYQQVQSLLTRQGMTGVDLGGEIADMSAICRGKDWVTTDPLGLGGLLCDAYRVMIMVSKKEFEGGMNLLENLLDACNSGLRAFVENKSTSQLKRRADRRLAFRELGLSIGLQSVSRMQSTLKEHVELITQNPRLSVQLTALEQHTHLVDTINSFWSVPSNQASQTWKEHLDINMVMLATSLMPDGFLAV